MNEELIVDIGNLAVLAFDVASIVAWVVLIYTVDPGRAAGARSPAARGKAE